MKDKKDIYYCKFCGKSSEDDIHFNKKRELCNRHLIQISRYGKCFTDEELKIRKSQSQIKDRNSINGDLPYWKDKDGKWSYNLGLLKEYIKKESSQFSCIEELTKHMCVHRSLLTNIERDNNIKFEYNFNINKFNSKFKDIYQDYNWCYQKYIVEGLNHKEMAIEAKCSKRVIEKWCVENHRLTQKYRQHNKRLSNTQRDLIIGSLLGDGHIDKRETQPLFVVSHAENQKDYLYWKYEILKDLCNIKPTYIKEKIHKFNNKEYLCQPSYRLCTRIYDCLIPLRNMNKYEIIDDLNEFSLSIFILDDGYRSSSRWQLCIAGLKLEERLYFIKILKNKFNIECTLTAHDDRYIDFNKDISKYLDSMILKYIPKDLDIIKYKILNKGAY